MRNGTIELKKIFSKNFTPKKAHSPPLHKRLTPVIMSTTCIASNFNVKGTGT
jgi:hypothetical protein